MPEAFAISEVRKARAHTRSHHVLLATAAGVLAFVELCSHLARVWGQNVEKSGRARLQVGQVPAHGPASSVSKSDLGADGQQAGAGLGSVEDGGQPVRMRAAVSGVNRAHMYRVAAS